MIVGAVIVLCSTLESHGRPRSPTSPMRSSRRLYTGVRGGPRMDAVVKESGPLLEEDEVAGLPEVEVAVNVC
jgi:hypothetical protein